MSVTMQSLLHFVQSLSVTGSQHHKHLILANTARTAWMCNRYILQGLKPSKLQEKAAALLTKG
jgi:hypothetical protein